MRTLALSLAVLTATPALAAEFDAVPRQPGKIGLGLGGGTDVSGLSMKYTFDDSFSIQGVVGYWSRGRYYYDDDYLGISASFLVEMPAITETPEIELGWAVGAGPYLGIGNDFWLGGHGVIGLELNVKEIPLEFTIEFRPNFLLIGAGAFDFDPVSFGGHLRWWF